MDIKAMNYSDLYSKKLQLQKELDSVNEELKQLGPALEHKVKTVKKWLEGKQLTLSAQFTCVVDSGSIDWYITSIVDENPKLLMDGDKETIMKEIEKYAIDDYWDFDPTIDGDVNAQWK